MRGKRNMLDINGVGLDDLRMTWQDPLGSVGEWDGAYTDQHLVQGLSYVYGACIRLICDRLPEPFEFYLGPGKPLQLITLTFRSRRSVIRTGSGITQKRRRDNANATSDGASQQEKSRQAKGKGAKSSKKWHKKIEQTKNDRRAAALLTTPPSQDNAGSSMWESTKVEEKAITGSVNELPQEGEKRSAWNRAGKRSGMGE